MAIDPSIPLGIHLYSFLDDEAKRQQIAASQAQIDEHRQKMEQDRAEREAYGSIFSGAGSVADATNGRPSPQAMGALARVNPEAAFKVQEYFSKLDETSRKREADKYKAAAPVLLRMKQIPYAQRGAFMQSAAPALIANGWTPQELQSFDPTDEHVEALSSAAMTVGEVTDSMKLNWHPIGENGSFATDQFGNPTGSGNPFAPSSTPLPSGGGGQSGNNNPGALRVPGSTQFQNFPNEGAGIQAQHRQLSRYFGRGINTVSEIVETYAPRKSRGGDNTDEQVNNYIAYVAQRLGVNPADTLSPAVLQRLAGAMREFETGHRSSGYSGRVGDGSAGLVSSKAEFDRLPSGTHFIAPDGSERVKP